MRDRFTTFAVALGLLTGAVSVSNPAAADQTVGQQFQRDVDALGDAFRRDSRALGNKLKGFVTGKERGQVAEPAQDPTPVDRVPEAEPFHSDRDPEVREAAGVALDRISGDANVDSIEGVRRPDGRADAVELRLRLTNQQVWDAALERNPSPLRSWKVTRLTRIE